MAVSDGALELCCIGDAGLRGRARRALAAATTAPGAPAGVPLPISIRMTCFGNNFPTPYVRAYVRTCPSPDLPGFSVLRPRNDFFRVLGTIVPEQIQDLHGSCTYSFHVIQPHGINERTRRTRRTDRTDRTDGPDGPHGTNASTPKPPYAEEIQDACRSCIRSGTIVPRTRKQSFLERGTEKPGRFGDGYVRTYARKA